jgi:hypothetical protein
MGVEDDGDLLVAEVVESRQLDRGHLEVIRPMQLIQHHQTVRRRGFHHIGVAVQDIGEIAFTVLC